MQSAGFGAAVALLAGASGVAILSLPIDASSLVWCVPGVTALAWAAWWFGSERIAAVLALGGFVLAGAGLFEDARSRALWPTLRLVLDHGVGGFAIDHPLQPDTAALRRLRFVLQTDALVESDAVRLEAEATAIEQHGEWVDVRGGVRLRVQGGHAPRLADAWRAGRTLVAMVALRRPSRNLNDGLPNAELEQALAGTALVGSIKSGLLVSVEADGGSLSEWAGHLRGVIRTRIRQWVSRHDLLSGSIVTAILIGDRAGLPDAVRLRLQAAGTYHVIAISGGNIAILAALILVALRLFGCQGRPAAAMTAVVLGGYAGLVATEPSVWRATVMAWVYLVARSADQRAGPWQAVAVAAIVAVCARPLDVLHAGFILTFGATGALLATASLAPRWASVPRPARWLLQWLGVSVLASVAIEVALLPVFASEFGLITAAGPVLNLAAIPLMTVAQIAGLAVVLSGPWTWLASLSGWVAHLAAEGLVASAGLVDWAPWLVRRVPAPSGPLIATFYVALGMVWFFGGGVRRTAAVVLLASAVGVVSGPPTRRADQSDHPVLRVTMLDVGQGEAVLLETPRGPTILVDAGGIPFGEGFDVGARIVVPALWARGVRRLGTLVMTHAHPDHIGGAAAVVQQFRPLEVWEGVAVSGHDGRARVLAAARASGALVHARHTGDRVSWGDARVRVLHPSAATWQRPQPRNDDSLVLEVLYGDVALLLTGDVSAEVERAILPQLTPATHRVLKIAHHGSQTSTSGELVTTWQPDLALVSAGRGNTFGHPARTVIERLREAGVQIYRTDRDGEITLETDGQGIVVRTWSGRRGELAR